MHVRSAETQINLHIRAIWSKSPQGTTLVAKDPNCLQVDSKDSDSHYRGIIYYPVQSWYLFNTYPYYQRSVQQSKSHSSDRMVENCVMNRSGHLVNTLFLLF